MYSSFVAVQFPFVLLAHNTIMAKHICECGNEHEIEDDHVHVWVPQITGNATNIEACEECLETRHV
jgi:hypothetical protein